jgi:hypothetical protein
LPIIDNNKTTRAVFDDRIDCVVIMTKAPAKFQDPRRQDEEKKEESDQRAPLA